MESPIFEKGELYAFEHEKDRVKQPGFTWWECIEIRGRWAILYKMSKDYKGDPRPSTTEVEIDTKGIIRGPKLTVLYIDEFYVQDGKLQALILEGYNKDDAVYKIGFNEKDDSVNYFQILPKK